MKVGLIANTQRRDHKPRNRNVSSERHHKSKTSEPKDVSSTRMQCHRRHRNVLVKSCGIGLSHRTPMLQLAPRNSQASKSQSTSEPDHIRGHHVEREEGLTTFLSKVVIARRVLGVSEPTSARRPRLSLTRSCVSPRVCVSVVWPASGKAAQGILNVARRVSENNRKLELCDCHSLFYMRTWCTREWS